MCGGAKNHNHLKDRSAKATNKKPQTKIHVQKTPRKKALKKKNDPAVLIIFFRYIYNGKKLLGTKKPQTKIHVQKR